MGLESGTFIADLVATNPTGSDDPVDGDNHIRLIKSVLKAQFPNLGAAAVTPTAAQLNDLIDSNRGVPTGAIVMWSGSVASIPTGWKLCDGTLGTPNLQDRFIVGSTTDTGGTHDVGDTGGSMDIVISSKATDDHSLTAAQVIHLEKFSTTTGIFSNVEVTLPTDGTYSGYSKTENNNGSGSDTAIRMKLKASASGHKHNLNFTQTGANKPAFYALAFIMKA